VSFRRAWLKSLICLCLPGSAVLSSGTVALAAAPEAPRIEQASLLDVSSSSATLSATINPGGAATSYTFEYAPRGGAFVPVPEAAGKGTVAEGTQGVSVSVELQEGLLPNTAYQFHVVASNSARTVTGEPVAFTTQRPGGALILPDGRQWELVSPPNKHGAGIEPIGFSVLQASAEGNAITYEADDPTELNPPGSALLESNVLSRRCAPGVCPTGWSSQNIAPPSEELVEFKSTKQYKLFSPNLQLALLEPFSETSLVKGSPGHFAYLRENPLGTAGGYMLLGNSLLPGYYTPDLSHIVLNTEKGLIEWSAGQTESVPSCSVGYGEIVADRHRLSLDGTRMVCGGGGYTPLVLNDLTRKESIRLDALAGGSAAGEVFPIFQQANGNDSQILFVDYQELTANAALGPNLYEFKLTSGSGQPLAGELADLTVPLNAGEGAGFYDVLLGASEDDSYIYFKATSKLTSSATAGAVNLYVSHGGTTTLVASMSPQDSAGNLQGLGASVSHNGHYAAFMSKEPLTGYNNHDVISGEPDEEVYLYDALANRLTCVSCNPTGARPLGLHVTEGVREGTTALVDRGDYWTGKWVAALIPGYTAISFGAQTASYRSRVLSDEGRLFLDSSDALVPQATNGKMNVYEYEPEGLGSCDRASATYSGQTGGCVTLISSGTSGEESAFIDASERGSDVFFLTASKLVSQDFDDAIDVYDAHICTASVPCTTPLVAPPPCVTADSCRVAPSPQPTIFGASGSATFSGAGNVTPRASSTNAVPKGPNRRQRLAAAIRACRAKHRGQAARRRCEALAQRRYGSGAKAKVKKRTTRRTK
jgi:hypothetical protein